MPTFRLLTPALGHAATIIAAADGSAFVVDPGRDIRPILALADEHELRITHVADTHGHNDYLSGLASLVSVTGATTIALDGSPGTYPAERLADGGSFVVGDIVVELLHTPGHTPEHVAFLVRTPGEAPVLVSGGTLLVGDVGRPDLLGGEGEVADATRALADTTLDRVMALGDDVRVLPTHVAGSLCGGAIGAGSETTIGAERAANGSVRAMRAAGEDRASWLDLATLPPVPAYWPRMRGANLAGVPAEEVPQAPARLDAPAARDAMLDDPATIMLDARTAPDFARRHVADALFVPAGDGLATWAGSILPPDAPVLLVCDDEHAASTASLDMWRIGLGPAIGWMPAEQLDAWESAGGATCALAEADCADAFGAQAAGEATIVDVRSPLEAAAQPITGATVLPATLLGRRPELAPPGPLLLACASGMRSTVVTALLVREGRTDVRNIAGGVTSALTVQAP